MDFYSFGKTLGEGAYGKVKLGTQLLTNEKVAVKTFEKSKLTETHARKRVAREIRILKALNHPHIIRLYEVISLTVIAIFKCGVLTAARAGCRCAIPQVHHYAIQQRRRLVSLCERAPSPIGAGIMPAVRSNSTGPGGTTSVIFLIFSDAILIRISVQYCHLSSIVHRDVKLDNLLIDENKNIKIVDFGFSVSFKPGQKLRTFCLGILNLESVSCIWLKTSDPEASRRERT